MPEDEEYQEIEELREIEESDEAGPTGKSRKFLIGLLSLIVFLALFVFFKGEKTQKIDEGVTIQPPAVDESSPFSESFLEEGFDQADPGEAGEIRIGEEEAADTPGDGVEETIIPISKEDLAFLDSLEDQQVDRAPSESEGLSLLKSERSKVAPPVKQTVKPSVKKTVQPPVKKSVKPPIKQALAVDRPGNFSIQLGAFKEEKSADSLMGRLRKSGYNAYILRVNKSLFRVRVGNFKLRQEAEKVAGRIKKSDRLDSFIVTN